MDVAAAEAAKTLPRAVEVLPATAGGTIAAIEKLNECVAISEKVIRHAQTAEGAIRNPKLLLQASEHLRRDELRGLTHA